MNLFSYPFDLFSWALFILTFAMAATVATNKHLVRRQKYLALSLTFVTAGALGLIALYSLLLCVAVTLSMAALFALLFFTTGGRRFDTQNLTPVPCGNSLLQIREVSADLLPESDPRPLPGIRLISGRRS